ncbi:SMI1/KNR4 family protein [Streptomyces sp. NPDC054961]
MFPISVAGPLGGLSRVLEPCAGSAGGGPRDLLGAARAERELGLRLPAEYLAFMEAYGGGLADVYEDCPGGGLWIAPPYTDSSDGHTGWAGVGLVDLTLLFREQAAERHLPHTPAGWTAGSLVAWGFGESEEEYFWLVTGEDADSWPVVETIGEGGPYTVHDCGMAVFLERTCRPGPVGFLHWREHDRLTAEGHHPWSE